MSKKIFIFARDKEMKIYKKCNKTGGTFKIQENGKLLQYEDKNKGLSFFVVSSDIITKSDFNNFIKDFGIDSSDSIFIFYHAGGKDTMTVKEDKNLPELIKNLNNAKVWYYSVGNDLPKGIGEIVEKINGKNDCSKNLEKFIQLFLNFIEEDDEFKKMNEMLDKVYEGLEKLINNESKVEVDSILNIKKDIIDIIESVKEEDEQFINYQGKIGELYLFINLLINRGYLEENVFSETVSELKDFLEKHINNR